MSDIYDPVTWWLWATCLIAVVVLLASIAWSLWHIADLMRSRAYLRDLENYERRRGGCGCGK